MKKMSLLLLVLLLLNGCNSIDKKTEHSVTKQVNKTTIKQIKPIIVGNKSLAYIVGGLINDKWVNYQTDDNYKLFDMSETETYMIFSQDGTTQTVSSTHCETSFVPAANVWETTVHFEQLYDKYIGTNQTNINNIQVVNTNDDIEFDFDGDGKNEKIIINQWEDKNKIEIVLECQKSTEIIKQFKTDGIYTDSYNIYITDFDDNKNYELTICLYGHSYLTEIYNITSDGYKKVLEYYMGN